MMTSSSKRAHYADTYIHFLFFIGDRCAFNYTHPDMAGQTEGKTKTEERDCILKEPEIINYDTLIQ